MKQDTYEVGSEKNLSSPNKVPARICTSSVPAHKDKMFGKGAVVEGWVCLVYLKAAGTMILHDQVTEQVHEILAKPGQLITFPNSRFLHEYATSSYYEVIWKKPKKERK